MSPLLRPDAPVPVLILTDEDYRRAFAPDAPELPPPPRRSRKKLLVAAAAVVLATSGAAIVWLRRDKPAPPPAAAPVARAPAAAREVAPPPSPAQAPPLRAAVAPPPPASPEADDEPVPVPAAPPRAPEHRPWLGDRAWVRFKLRMERSSHVQESEQRVTIAWDGSRYAIERSGSRGEPWLDRLELLVQLPTENDGWARRVTRTSSATLRVESQDLVCRVVEGEDRFPQGVRRFRYWYSDEFPAGAVLAQQTLEDITLVCRVLEFGPASAHKP
jgi:hypothetical protein